MVVVLGPRHARVPWGQVLVLLIKVMGFNLLGDTVQGILVCKEYREEHRPTRRWV